MTDVACCDATNMALKEATCEETSEEEGRGKSIFLTSLLYIPSYYAILDHTFILSQLAYIRLHK